MDEPDSNTHYRWTCTGTGDPKGADKPCSELKNAPSSDCAAGVDKSWTVGANTCDATTSLTGSGANGSVTDSTGPTTGTAQYLCTNGSWAAAPQAGATCAVAAGPIPVTNFYGFYPSSSPFGESVLNLPAGGGNVRIRWSVTTEALAQGGSCTGYSTTGLPGWSVTGTSGKSSDQAGSFAQINDMFIPSTTRFDLDCWSALGVAADRKQVQVNVAASSPTLNICPSSATIGEASPQPFKAWHSASGVDFGSCLSKNAASTDVTNLTAWESTVPAKVSIDPNNGNAIGVAAGFASINASYSGIAAAPAPVTVTAAVACPRKQCSDFATDIARTCTTKNYVASDGCGGQVSCPGTRVCDYNWKEVAP